jgi:hypothetical protein
MSSALSPSMRASGRLPFGLVGMIGLVVAIEGALARNDHSIIPISAADWRLTRAAVSGEAMRAEVLCFGDSLVKTGVVPNVIESRLGRPVYNLAALGAPPPASFFLLRKALEAGARPRAIIYDFKASTLPAEYRGFIRDWAELIGPRDAYELAMEDRDPGLLGLYLAHRLVPSVRLRLDLRTAIADQLAGKPPAPGADWFTVLERQHGQNHGAMVNPTSWYRNAPDPFPNGTIPAGVHHLYYPESWTPRATNLNFVRKFLDLAASRDIPVFVLLPPIHPAVLAERERRGLDSAYEAIVRKVHGRYKNVVVVDGRHSGYKYDMFIDTSHLDHDGAAAHSQSLADLIARRLDGEPEDSRWVALPGPSVPATAVAVEDIGGSRQAVESGRFRR